MRQSRKEFVISTALIGAALLLLSVTYGRTEESKALDLLSKIAFALLVAVLIRGITTYVYRDRTADFNKFLELGMEDIHEQLSDQKVREFLSRANHIKVLKTWFPESEQVEAGLERAVVDGNATVQLLLCHPDSTLLAERSLGAGHARGWGSSMVFRAIERMHQASLQAPQASVQIALYEGWPGCPVIWHDQHILLGFYFRGKASPAWPWITIRNKSHFASICNANFQDLWQQARVRLTNGADMQSWLESHAHYRA